MLGIAFRERFRGSLEARQGSGSVLGSVLGTGFKARFEASKVNGQLSGKCQG